MKITEKIKKLNTVLIFIKNKVGVPTLKNTLFLFVFFFVFFLLDMFLQYRTLTGISIGGVYHIVKTTIIWSFLLLSIYLFFGKYSRYFYIIFLPFFILFEFAELFYRIYFNQTMSGNVILICAASSWSESKKFIELYFSFTTFFLLLILVTLIAFMIWFVWNKCKGNPNKYTVLGGIAAVLLFLIAEFPGIYRYPESIFSKTLLGMFCIDSCKVINNYKTLLNVMKNPELPTGISVIPAENGENNLIGIIILGESSTRNSWGLYGYSRNTTPKLSQHIKELLIWKDVVGVEGDTCSALYKLLTQSTIEEPLNVKCTIFDVFKKSGFEVILVSSQNQWRNENGVLVSLFKSASECIYIETDYDMVLFETLKRKIGTIKKNTIFVLHTKGSHYPPDKYYPKEFHPFKDVVDKENRNYSKERQNIINHYDNAVAYTDKFIDCVIEEVNNKHVPSFVFYISDHGETPRSPVWRDFSHKDCWELPMFVWLSDDYKKAHPSVWKNAEKNLTAPLQSDKLFWSFLSLARITCHDFPYESDIFSDRFVTKNKPRMILSSKIVNGGRIEYKK